MDEPISSDVAANPLKRSLEETVDPSDKETKPESPAAKKVHLEAESQVPAVAASPVPVADVKTEADEEEMMMQMMSEGVDPLAAGPSNPTKKAQGKNVWEQDSRPQRKGKGRENYKGRDTGYVGDGSTVPPVKGEDGEEEKEKETKYPKRKVALFVGYSGTGYSGMQFQTRPPTGTWNEITIEGLFFEALTKLGLISAANSSDPKKIDLQRAARTDKGVSAAGNVVSMKMITEFPGLEDKDVLVREVNKLLPDDVRLWGYVRSLSGFNARTACDTRVYEYLFPSYMLLPPAPGCKLDQEMKAFAAEHLASQNAEGGEVPQDGADPEEVHPFWAAVLQNGASSSTQVAPEAIGEDVKPIGEGSTDEGMNSKAEDGQGALPQAAEPAGVGAPSEGASAPPKPKGKGTTYLKEKRQWRVGEAELDRFKEMCKMYVGSHNFHNFTLFKPFNDKTVKRFILSIDVDKPQVYSGMEWISVKIHGQSFMLHQIRKMMALAMMASRTRTPASMIPAMFGRAELHIPKAPALGLLLENPRFGSFNQRAAKLADQNKQTQGGSPITFDPYREQIEAFKVKNIYEKMREEEDKAAIYHTWVSTIDTRGGAALSYLNRFGVIPDKAFKPTKPKGQPRAKADVKKEAEDEGAESDDGDEGVPRALKADDEE